MSAETSLTTAPTGRPEHLIVEDLVVLRAREVLGDAAQERIDDGVLRAAHDRNVEAARSGLALKLGLEKNLRNSTASFGEPLVTSQPLRPPSVSEGSPLPPAVVGNGNQPSFSSGMPFLSAAFARMLFSTKLPCSTIAPLPSPN